MNKYELLYAIYEYLRRVEKQRFTINIKNHYKKDNKNYHYVDEPTIVCGNENTTTLVSIEGQKITASKTTFKLSNSVLAENKRKLEFKKDKEIKLEYDLNNPGINIQQKLYEFIITKH